MRASQANYPAIILDIDEDFTQLEAADKNKLD
jgi:hypothetical protein